MKLTPEEESIIEEGLEALSRGCYSEPSKTKAYENLLKKFKKAKGFKLPLKVQEIKSNHLVYIVDSSGETILDFFKEHEGGHRPSFTLVDNALSKARQLVRCVNNHEILLSTVRSAILRENNVALRKVWQETLDKAKGETHES